MTSESSRSDVVEDITLEFSRRGRVLFLTRRNFHVEHIAALKRCQVLDINVRHSMRAGNRFLAANDVDLIVVTAGILRRRSRRFDIVGNRRLAGATILMLAEPRSVRHAKRIGLYIDHHLPTDVTSPELARVVAAIWGRIRYLRELSPDTGLPGTAWIFEHLQKRLAEGLPYALMFFDIDRFKAVSDVYGFARAGDFLRALATALTGAALRVGTPNPLIGHIGGDDFLVICEPSQVLPFTGHATAEFERAADKLYDPADAIRGYVLLSTRKGGHRRAALVTLSIGVIHSEWSAVRVNSLRDAAVAVSEMKHIAKSQPGSYVAVARQLPLPDSTVEPSG
ncbi:diguanylate cyclase [Micromonospora sp. NPDC051196]|uniref:diguanylate cyclase domain-containing protein n=1 Tax=Micromonospora sp. NPDC051196 TaxID=3155281 RepID=UPI0034383813